MLLKGGSEEIGGDGIIARKIKCSVSASYLWNGSCLDSQTSAQSHTTKAFYFSSLSRTKTESQRHSARTSRKLHMLEVCGDRETHITSFVFLTKEFP